MRRHAKASTAGSTQRQAAGRFDRGALATRGASSDAGGSGAPSRGPMRKGASPRSALCLACLAALCLASLALSALPASAAVVTDRPLLFKFNGADTTAGAFGNQKNLEVEQATGDVYTLDAGHKVIDKFNAAGVAQNFAATGKSSLGVPVEGNFFSDSEIVIDNSAVNPGRIYVQVAEGPGRAFDSAGNFLWELGDNIAFNLGCAAAFDTAGHLRVIDRGGSPEHVLEFASSGSPPAQIGSFPLTNTNGAASPCSIDLDSAGNLYVAFEFDGFSGKGVDKYVGGVFSSTLDPEPSRDVAVDQTGASGHIFTSHDESFNEYESSGALVGTFGKGVLSSGQGIAYNKALDRVYVANFSGPVVYAFGPKVTGTVPDVTSEAASAVGISKAELHGKVNPQSVPNSYFFEWKQGTEAGGWGAAKSSPPLALPEDSLEHAVSFSASGLNGDTTYQARLVGLNTANGLRSVSSPVTFTTAQAATAPAVTIAPPSPVTTTTAKVEGTVNPKEDFSTTWRVQVSTDPACASGFSEPPLHNLESEANSPVAVSEEITGLLPNQHYCVRIQATNSFGTTTSEAKEFTTLAAPPDQVTTAFAAPRTDTTARINAYLNPEGSTVTYRFEYSKDGGATWIVLPDREDSGKARKPILVADELSGLSPNTPYSYRFSAEDGAGPASPQGEEKTFTTRTSAEMNPPTRGFELVNNPDKGNQSVRAQSILGAPPMSADGERVFWNVQGSAPGGNSVSFDSFLAERTAGGWVSRALTPPAAEQVEPENGGYTLQTANPSLTRFLFVSGGNESGGGKALIRLDTFQHQDVLKTYEHFQVTVPSDLTGDGAHVLHVNNDAFGGHTPQLEDVGSAPEVVSLLPDGSEPECVPDFGSGPNPSGAGAQWRSGYHLMATTDASRVYFQVSRNGDCSGDPWLLERNRETGETLEVAPPSGQNELIRATPDGRSVYFLSDLALDAADTNSDLDVYRWDEEGEEDTCLTCVVADAKVRHTPVMVSDDSSHVYFESVSKLTPQATAGKANLYTLSGGSIRFVATTSAERALLRDQAALSSDGNVLVYGIPSGDGNANHELTADKLAASCVNPGSGNTHCLELFRYDDPDGSLECISCVHDGVTTESFGVAADGNDFTLSADGETVAFVTSQALVRLDVNNGLDLYEWRAGARRLVTDGLSDFNQESTGALLPHAVSADGRDILFSVVDPGLTGFEQDGLANLYDARIGGGFVAPNPPAHCSEEACQGPLQAPPPSLQPASSSFSGRGNLGEGRPRCARNRVRRHGRCVKRQRRHRRNHHKRAAHANRGRAK